MLSRSRVPLQACPASPRTGNGGRAHSGRSGQFLHYITVKQARKPPPNRTVAAAAFRCAEAASEQRCRSKATLPAACASHRKSQASKRRAPQLTCRCREWCLEQVIHERTMTRRPGVQLTPARKTRWASDVLQSRRCNSDSSPALLGEDGVIDSTEGKRSSDELMSVHRWWSIRFTHCTFR